MKGGVSQPAPSFQSCSLSQRAQPPRGLAMTADETTGNRHEIYKAIYIIGGIFGGFFLFIGLIVLAAVNSNSGDGEGTDMSEEAVRDGGGGGGAGGAVAAAGEVTEEVARLLLQLLQRR